MAERGIFVVLRMIVIGVVHYQHGLLVIGIQRQLHPLAERKRIIEAEIVHLASEAQLSVRAHIESSDGAGKYRGAIAVGIGAHLYRGQIRKSYRVNAFGDIALYRKLCIVHGLASPARRESFSYRATKSDASISRVCSPHQVFSEIRHTIPRSLSIISKNEKPPYAVCRSFQSANDAPLSCSWSGSTAVEASVPYN